MSAKIQRGLYVSRTLLSLQTKYGVMVLLVVIMLINVKMPTTVDILTFISLTNTTSKSLKQEKF